MTYNLPIISNYHILFEVDWNTESEDRIALNNFVWQFIAYL